ncbi:MAG TPA: PIN-like domain-containing protein [Pseudonocardiaceae bacterium]
MSTSAAFSRRPSINDLIGNGLLALDTGALLQQWRMGPDLRSLYRSCLDQLASRIFVPYQTLRELQDRVPTIINDTAQELSQVKRAIDENRWDAQRTKLVRRCHHAGLPRDITRIFQSQTQAAYELLVSAAEDRREELEADQEEAAEFLGYIRDMDWLTGQPPDKAKALDWDRRARMMVRQKVPPAIADNGNKPPEKARLGDCLIWLELLEVADWFRTDIVLVTEDYKPGGWVARHPDGALETNAYLVNTMWEAANVQFSVIGTDNLIDYCQQTQNAPAAPHLVPIPEPPDSRDAVVRPLPLFTAWNE